MSVTGRLADKRILIWGYGREGRSTERFLNKWCKPASVEIFEGARGDFDEASYDVIIKSPGIRMDDDDPRFTSQTEIFLEEYRDRVIGVTGTKGKSTTSAMLHHVIDDSILLGNIGEPCLDHFGEISPETTVVYEMSAHQLAHVHTSPHIAIFLNLYEEHLDFYDTLERYFAAKCGITGYQHEGDYLILGGNVPDIDTQANIIRLPFVTEADYKLQLLGAHNVNNANFVITVACDILGIDREKVIRRLETFTGLPHRLEYIGERDGIRYYDDSISTIPGAAIQALESVPDVGTIILGGMDRGIDYGILTDYIAKHPEYTYICCYESGRRIYEKVKDLDNVRYCDDLAGAVELAQSLTHPGEACLLSPASASYGHFKNFEHRGEVFQSLTVGAEDVDI